MGQFIRPKDGVVATYGVGKVMWLVQNGDQDGESRLTGLVKEFYDVKKCHRLSSTRKKEMMEKCTSRTGTRSLNTWTVREVCRASFTA